MKRLVICRHAHAERNIKGDFYRELDHKGKKSIKKIAERLAEQQLKPDLIISSPALRALQTAEALAKKLDYPKENIITEDAIYEQNINSILSFIKHVCSDETTVILTGHCPSVKIMASILTGTPEEKTPTGSATMILFNEKTWPEALNSTGKIESRELP